MIKAARGKYSLIKNEEIGPGVFEINVSSPGIAEAAAAGQFVNIYLPGGEMLLPRPIGIADVKGDTIALVFAVVGEGTRALSRFKGGEKIELMGPLGTGFFDYPGSTDPIPSEVLLIGGGAGVPPLNFAARKLKLARGNSVRLTAFLGFSKEPWYTGGLENACDEVWAASETEGAAAFHGNVVGLLDSVSRRGSGQWGPGCLALACGPRPMLAAAAQWCEARKIPLRVSMEERMGCGYGACAGCAIDTRPFRDESRLQGGACMPGETGIVKKKVCVDGPVFWADEVVW